MVGVGIVVKNALITLAGAIWTRVILHRPIKLDAKNPLPIALAGMRN